MLEDAEQYIGGKEVEAFPAVGSGGTGDDRVERLGFAENEVLLPVDDDVIHIPFFQECRGFVYIGINSGELDFVADFLG